MATDSTAERDLLDLAYYLGGVNDAWRVTGVPPWIDEREFCEHVEVARDVQAGGKYSGPVVLLAMAEYVDRLVGEMDALADHP